MQEKPSRFFRRILWETHDIQVCTCVCTGVCAQVHVHRCVHTGVCTQVYAHRCMCTGVCAQVCAHRSCLHESGGHVWGSVCRLSTG